MESNKDRQYRTDHDRCWYTVKVKLALLAHRPIPERRRATRVAAGPCARAAAGAAAPRSGSHILYRRRGNVAFLKCSYTIDARRVHLWLAVAWLDTPRLARGGLRVPLHVCAAQDAHMH